MHKRYHYYYCLDTNITFNIIMGIVWLKFSFLNPSALDVWLQSNVWLIYLFVALLIWVGINNNWGRYWQLTDNSLDYYSSFIRIKRIALADISQVKISEQKDDKQKLEIYSQQHKQNFSKPNKAKMTIDSDECVDFTGLIFDLQKKLSQEIQGTVDKNIGVIEYYSKKNKTITSLIWLFFLSIITINWQWRQEEATNLIKESENLLIIAVVMILINIVVEIWYKDEEDNKKIINSKVTLFMNTYIVLPFLALYLLYNLYMLL